jgi:hemerythrin superfamily protein
MEERGEDNRAARTRDKNGNGESGKADAMETLKEDHRHVERLFDKYQQAKRRAEKARIAQEICLELTIHATL